MYSTADSNYLNRQKEFQSAIVRKFLDEGFTAEAQAQTMGQPFVPGSSTAKLRATLIREEAEELAEALEVGTKEEVLKEMTDLLVVTFGTAAIYEFLARGIVPAYNRTCDNNMLKIKTGTIREDGKLKKAPDHPKPYLGDLV